MDNRGNDMLWAPEHVVDRVKGLGWNIGMSEEGGNKHNATQHNATQTQCNTTQQHCDIQRYIIQQQH
jgi:hypothetical protein